MSAMSVIGKTTSEKKEKLTKAIINIIRKLKTSTGSKREKYRNMVRTEFNLEKNEKWVLTKLRMMLVRLDAGLELLQITKSDKTRTKDRQFAVKEVSCGPLTTTESRVRSAKDTNVALQTKEQSRICLKSRKSRKSLESRQLEKLRNKKFDQEEALINTDNKVAFLSMMNLCHAVICL